MENEMTGYILTLLENYAKTTKDLELLRYDLQHCNIVSPEEMIETMALSRRENNPDSSYPHDVAGIAMCFREVTDRLNKNASNEVAAQYVALVRERERLQYYISLYQPVGASGKHGSEGALFFPKKLDGDRQKSWRYQKNCL